LGANPGTLLRVLASSGGVPLRRLPEVIFAVLGSLLRWPFSAFERARVRRLRRSAPPARPPVFILGHWRSGTTHVYNALCASGQFAYASPLSVGLPWDFLGLGRVMRPLLERNLPEDRLIDGIPVRPDSPQEDELALACMQPVSFYHGLYFPRRFRQHFDAGVFFDGCGPADIERWAAAMKGFHDKIQLEQPGRQLLVKNPAHTARVQHLQALWPDARFIHVYRNPYVVYQSMRRFFDVLLAELALQPYDELRDGALDRLILETYQRMMTTLLADAALLPPGRFVELRFEDFEEDPLGQLERVYGSLGLDDFASARPAFARYLEGVKGYRKNHHRPSADTLETITRAWRPFIERWGYGHAAPVPSGA
jgi:hypothetical protein